MRNFNILCKFGLEIMARSSMSSHEETLPSGIYNMRIMNYGEKNMAC